MAVIGKRGFLFTALALIIVVTIIILAASSDRLYPRSRTHTAYAHTMSNYLTNLEADLPRAAYIAGFRGLIGLEEHISVTGVYLTSFETAFAEMFTNGTANGSSYAIMDNSTFTDFSSRFSALAAKQGIAANLTLVSVEAYHESAWAVTLNFTVEILMRDPTGEIVFNRTITTTANVPIEDVKDPLYTVGTQGRAPHSIKRSNVTRPFITAADDTSGLQDLVNETLYIETSNAPNFVQRFEGNFSADPFGIASLVNVDELRAQDIPEDTCKSVVDYRYFAPTDSDPNRYIINMDQNDFWLSDEDLADFDAVGKIVGDAPC